MAQELPFEIPITITCKNNQPAVELRRLTTNPTVIKVLISCAFRGQTVIIKPVFTDSMKSLGNLVEKGIIYRDGEDYFFTF